MTWAGMGTLDVTPTTISVPTGKCSEEKSLSIESIIGKFVEKYVLAEFDVEKRQRQEVEYRNNARTISKPLQQLEKSK